MVGNGEAGGLKVGRGVFEVGIGGAEVFEVGHRWGGGLCGGQWQVLSQMANPTGAQSGSLRRSLRGPISSEENRPEETLTTLIDILNKTSSLTNIKYPQHLSVEMNCFVEHYKDEERKKYSLNKNCMMTPHIKSGAELQMTTK